MNNPLGNRDQGRMGSLLKALWTWLDRHRPRTVTGWIILILVLFVGGLFLRTWNRWSQLNRFQYAIERKYEILYFSKEGERSHNRKLHYGPAVQMLHKVCDWWIDRFPTDNGRDYWGSRSSHVYANPIVASFYWKVRGIEAYDLQYFTPEAGKALKAFPHLTFFSFAPYEAVYGHDQEAVDSLMKGIGRLKKLRELRLKGPWLKPEDLEVLPTLPRLEILKVSRSQSLDGRLIPILARCKSLKVLELQGVSLTHEQAVELARALPGAAIYFDDWDGESALPPNVAGWKTN